MLKTKKDHLADTKKGKAILTYWPRIRFFKDRKGDFHLAGEPDGLSGLVIGFRYLHNRWRNRLSIALESEPIPAGRHPIRRLGVNKIYEILQVSFTPEDKQHIELVTKGNKCHIIVSKKTLPILFIETYDAYKGDGDSEIEVVDRSGSKPVQRWLHFWGYANPHGVNTF